MKTILLVIYLSMSLRCVICQVSIEVKLYNSNDPKESLDVNEDTELDKLDGFCKPENLECKNYIITHGFMADGKSGWIEEMKNELIGFDKQSNVFVLDWSNGSMTGALGYNEAVQNVHYAALVTAKLFKSLSKYFDKSNGLVNLHCIGHSLGSHVCGMTGKFMKKLNLKFKRITGLDPAGPCFEDFSHKYRLHMEDADYVDAIHTSSVLGYNSPIGHSDFYPNGGTFQPGCYFKTSANYRPRSVISSFSKRTLCKREIEIGELNERLVESLKDHVTRSISSQVDFFSLFSICSHGRAYEFFTESIRSPCGFISDECKSYSSFEKGECKRCASNSMGFNSTKKENPTSYYLQTFPDNSFCMPRETRSEVCKNKAFKIECHILFQFYLVICLVILLLF